MKHLTRVLNLEKGLVEMTVTILGDFDENDTLKPGDEPYAAVLAFALSELFAARRFFKTWPGIGEDIYHVNGHITLTTVSRVFSSDGGKCGASIEYCLRQRKKGEIVIYGA